MEPKDEKRMEARLAGIDDENVKAEARRIFYEKGYDAMKTFTFSFIYGMRPRKVESL